ncbi:MAG: hypothetical protein GX369_02850 [Euryarchaeota archaeon]|nr:hypothetical protein [Euryarchaeota archaeon]
MNTGIKNTLGVLLVGLGIVALIILLLLNLSFMIEATLLIISIILFIVAALIIVGVVAIVPFYFVKRGSISEPSNNYKLDDIRPIKEDERK